jgi:bidirectional [NiFe] hydrogenase diaphorase subunit
MRFVLNGRKRQAPEGTTVLEAARAAGVDVPAVCAHDALQPYGACRLCVVEVTEKGSGRSKVVASCLYPVKEDLVVQTETPRIRRLRKFLLELLIARSPDAPYVRKLARRYGVTAPRFSPTSDNCILCGLCVRVCSEVIGASAIGFSGRGIARKIDSPFGIDHSRCIACGACTYVCPTGAVQMEHERVEELRASSGEHPCRYTLMGFLPDAVCSLNYECFRCETDQKFRAEAQTHPMLARDAERRRKASPAGGASTKGRRHKRSSRARPGNRARRKAGLRASRRKTRR